MMGLAEDSCENLGETCPLRAAIGSPAEVRVEVLDQRSTAESYRSSVGF